MSGSVMRLDAHSPTTEIGLGKFKEYRDKHNQNDVESHRERGVILVLFEHILDRLANALGIREEYKANFKTGVLALAEEFGSRHSQAKLPDKPVRDYTPRQEDIIDYLKSTDGFRPWIEAKALTRPLIRKKAPKAYTALANWLRDSHNDLSEVGLRILTKSEVVDQELADVEAITRARRLVRALHRRSAKSGKAPEPP